MTDLRPVILSGGSGTRLWPLSTAEVPKQFAKLIGDRSLFGMTIGRLEGVEGLVGSLVVTGRAQLDLVRSEVEASPVDVRSIIVEPAGRNTAPAAVAAALVADPGDTLVILPSDHLIADVSGFKEAVASAARLADSGGIVTFGIQPTRPETGYGYIEVGAAVGKGHQVLRFKEKPDATEAEQLVADGRHLWNSGMFVVRADHLLSEAERHIPGILSAVQGALPDKHDGEVALEATFAEVEAISFDHALMERTDRALVVTLDVGWSDVGSYVSLLEALQRDAAGNHVSGAVTIQDVTGSFIRATSRPVVVSGLDDVIVVETADAVLVLPLERAQDVRDLQERARAD